jgi:diguanylate cyclase (GGDEF)-like protein
MKGHKQAIFGEDIVNFELTDYQQKHLNKNNRLLLALNSDNNQPQLLMLNVLDSDSRQILVAILNPEYLWDIVIQDADLFCAVVDQELFMYCPDLIYQSDNLSKIKDQLASDKRGLDETTLDGVLYLSNQWDLFLDGIFGFNGVSIIYFMPRNDAFLEYDYYIDALPQSILITLLIVFSLSSVQMRRSLTPLMKLTQGAKNIIAGNYTKTVDINSNDEFEVLGSTFNTMSHRIDEAFKKITTLAKIDRLILSTSDSEYIVEVLIEYIPSIIPADNIAIFILDLEKGNEGNLFFNNKSNHDISNTILNITKSEIDELNKTDGIIIKTKADKHGYLSPLITLGNTTFLISPIRNQEILLGFICTCFQKHTEISQELSDSLTEICDRAAVAFSNAIWENKLFHQAHYDSLTTLPNRYLFQDRLEQAIERAKRNDLNVAILFIDLDRFKNINDSLGHTVGDELLIQVSKILLKCVRAHNSVARFGGDEFTAIISDVNDMEVKVQTERLARRINELLSEPIFIDDRKFNISASIGIAMFPGDADNINDLLKNADTAMYEAKRVAVGNHQYYKKQQNKETLELLELETELKHAIENNELILHYQPKVNLHDGMIYSVESLIRWNHPERGLVSPGTFIPLAEQTGLITDIGYWIMRTACKQCKVWHDNNIEIKIAVNLSVEQFKDENLYENVVAILDETGVDIRLMELEVTESLTIEDTDKSIALLTKFRDKGLGITIDDFGTGFSSMSYLQKLPINKLKIDKSFIDNVHLDDDSASIVRAIVGLAHALSLSVVAEGVEEEAQYDFLKTINCDEIQGFYFSKPLPEDKLLEHVLSKNSRNAKV